MIDPAKNDKRKGRLRQVFYLLPFIFLFSWATNYLYLRGAIYSDLTISHYPNLLFLRDALIEFKRIPLWSPAILSGYPFFADPLSGIWYPPGWLAAVWPAPWTFNLLAFVHMGFGAIGLGGYLRSKGLSQGAQLLGGVSFGLMPKLIAHYAAGHITLLYAIAWTPWLLLSIHRKGRFFRPGVLLGIIFLTDPRWAVYAGVLWLAYSFAHSQEVGGRVKGITAWGRTAAPELLISVLFASPLLVPLIEFTRLSSRALITPDEALVFSLPVLRIAGLLLPLVGGQVEWVFFAGGVVLLGCISAAVLPSTRKKTLFWFAILSGSLLFSLGDQVPLLGLWAHLPGANLLRVPSRALFLFGLSLSVLMAYGYHELLLRELTYKKRKTIRLIAIAWTSIGLVFVFTSFNLSGGVQDGLAWAGISSLAGSVGLFLVTAPGVSRRIVLIILLLFVILDSGAFAYQQITPISEAEIEAQGAEAAAWISAQPGHFRVYSPSYSIPQHTAARFGLELTDGVDPLQLRAYSDFMEDASGVLRSGYRVTVPAMDGEPATANAGFVPDSELLGLLNVRYVVSEYPLEVDGLEIKKLFGRSHVYENQLYRERVWVEGGVGDVPEITFWSPNRIGIACECESGLLTLSEIDYPGWQVTGGDLQDPAYGILRSIKVHSSTEIVELTFRPTSLYVGLLLWSAGFAWLIVVRKRERDEQQRPS